MFQVKQVRHIAYLVCRCDAAYHGLGNFEGSPVSCGKITRICTSGKDDQFALIGTGNILFQSGSLTRSNIGIDIGSDGAILHFLQNLYSAQCGCFCCHQRVVYSSGTGFGGGDQLHVHGTAIIRGPGRGVVGRQGVAVFGVFQFDGEFYQYFIVRTGDGLGSDG